MTPPNLLAGFSVVSKVAPTGAVLGEEGEEEVYDFGPDLKETTPLEPVGSIGDDDINDQDNDDANKEFVPPAGRHALSREEMAKVIQEWYFVTSFFFFLFFFSSSSY